MTMDPDEKELIKLTEWKLLERHYAALSAYHLRDLVREDPARFDRFSLHVENILLDYSKTHIQSKTIDLLIQLANTRQLPQKISDLFAGKIVNTSEKQPALHTALRYRGKKPIFVEGMNVTPLIQETLNKMRVFVEKVNEGTWVGYDGSPIKNVIVLGIGGSHLGPQLAMHALNAYANTHLRFHFISNVDGTQLHNILHQIDPCTTLAIISSKSFSTVETLANAEIVKRWLQAAAGIHCTKKNWIAVTANANKAMDWGIPAMQIFPLWPWVGGRYSVWSAIGLPLALAIGMDNFLDFLKGAEKMDRHFQETPFHRNMPVILGLIGIWYHNFHHVPHQVIIPYESRLLYLPEYLQQLSMESQGKQVTCNGEEIDYPTGAITWGGQGCNSQHAFHQLFYQGQHRVLIDFIIAVRGHAEYATHQRLLLANCFSQSQALMQGITADEIRDSLQAQGLSAEEIKQQIAHQKMPGNQASHTLLLDDITPENLGALLALYEHKTFVQSVIWGINPFDQWGVELGKKIAKRILTALEDETIPTGDQSTAGLIAHLQKKLKCPL